MSNNFSRLSQINVRLDTKVIKDGGMDTVTSAANGKVVTFNETFRDIREIQVTPEGSAATKRTAFYSFQDIPNPTNMTVFLVDMDGNLQTGNFSWHVEGV